MTGADGKLTASELALDNYMDALLQEPGEEVGHSARETAGYHLFEVSGLLVGVPAARVSAEIPLPELQQGPAQPAWLHRVAADDDSVIVDTALLVLPEDLAPHSIPLQERCDSILLLDDGRWGLAVEGWTHEEAIAADSVCWRGPQGKRLWLSGALASRRCVLLDLDNIQQLGRFTAVQR